MICYKFEFVGFKVEVHLDEKVFQIQLFCTLRLQYTSHHRYSRVQKSIENWSVCSKMALAEVGVSLQ